MLHYAMTKLTLPLPPSELMANPSEHLHGDSTPPEASAEVEAIFNQTPNEDSDEHDEECEPFEESRDHRTDEDASQENNGESKVEKSDIFREVEIDRSFESTSEPLENEVSRPYRPTWCFDATLQQAGFYVDGYGIIADPITTAEKIHKPKPFPRSCALEAAEARSSPRLRHVLRGGNTRSEISPADAVEVSKPASVPQEGRVSRHYKITGMALISGALLVSVMAFIAGYSLGLVD